MRSRSIDFKDACADAICFLVKESSLSLEDIRSMDSGSFFIILRYFEKVHEEEKKALKKKK